MLEELNNYYSKCGIAAVGFHCRHEAECSGGAGDFIGAREASVGAEYERGTLSRLLFVSADPATDIAGRDAVARSVPALREWEARQPRSAQGGASFPKNRHWYQTYEFAHRLLSPIARERGREALSFSEMHKYFAHTNSAKCKDVAVGTTQGKARMFRNCREFLPGEIQALRPDILVTQGAKARESLEGAFPVLLAGTAPGGTYHATVVEIGSRPVLKFEMVHPTVHDNSYRDEVAGAWRWYALSAAAFASGGVAALSALGFREA